MFQNVLCENGDTGVICYTVALCSENINARSNSSVWNSLKLTKDFKTVKE